MILITAVMIKNAPEIFKSIEPAFLACSPPSFDTAIKPANIKLIILITIRPLAISPGFIIEMSFITPTIMSKARDIFTNILPTLSMFLASPPLVILPMATISIDNPTTIAVNKPSIFGISLLSIFANLFMAIARMRMEAATPTIGVVDFLNIEVVSPILLAAKARAVTTAPRTTKAPIAPHIFFVSSLVNNAIDPAKIAIAIAMFSIALDRFSHALAARLLPRPVNAFPIPESKSPKPSRGAANISSISANFFSVYSIPTVTAAANTFPKSIFLTISMHLEPIFFNTSHNVETPF